MSLTIYGPADPWPRHQKAYWRASLKLAREAGWSLHYLGAGHRFGILTCPSGDHTVAVDQTARGGETVAKEVPKRLGSCSHGAATLTPRAERRRAHAEQLLATAEQLIDVAEGHLGQLESSQAAWAELERLELLVESAEVTLAEVREEQEAAWEAAVAAEEARETHSIVGTLDQAQAASEEARGETIKMKRDAAAKPLTKRLDAADARIAGLRARVSAL